MPVWLQALEVGLYVAVVISVLQVVLHVVEGLDIAVVQLSKRNGTRSIGQDQAVLELALDVVHSISKLMG